METGLLAVATLALAASALILFGIGQRLVKVEQALSNINCTLRARFDGGCHGPPPWYGLMGSPAGYAIYVYRDGKWLMEADLSRPGFESMPPSMQGAYEGQVVKRESIPRQEQ